MPQNATPLSLDEEGGGREGEEEGKAPDGAGGGARGEHIMAPPSILSEPLMSQNPLLFPSQGVEDRMSNRVFARRRLLFAGGTNPKVSSAISYALPSSTGSSIDLALRLFLPAQRPLRPIFQPTPPGCPPSLQRSVAGQPGHIPAR